MSDQNPYQPPRAPVEDVVSLSGGTPPFFAVGTTKLLVMTFATFGFYELYWFYRHWATVKRREQSGLWPIARAIFGVIFAWALFRRIGDAQRAIGVATPLAALPWAVVLILLNAAFRLPDPWWLLNFASVLPLLVAQAAANEVNAARAPGHDANRAFTQLNWIAVAASIPVWLLTLLAMLRAPAA